jgi:chromatin segregation and condensation protein Rec8/ScpA/Scc1 (kleisin family)
VTFLAILELAKQGIIELFQKEGQEDIILIPKCRSPNNRTSGEGYG